MIPIWKRIFIAAAIVGGLSAMPFAAAAQHGRLPLTYSAYVLQQQEAEEDTATPAGPALGLPDTGEAEKINDPEPTEPTLLPEDAQEAADELDADAADTDQPSVEPDAEQSEAPKLEPKPEPVPELSPEMVALRDRVRQVLAYHHRYALSTASNTATEVMHACLAFGCQAEVSRGGSSRERLNAVTCLCWNFPCAGYEPLTLSKGHLAGRIGYGFQQRPSQLLAVLALARAPADYPARVGDDVRDIADLVEYEKLTCRADTDLSLKLIGLSFYVSEKSSWENDLGETWSLSRIVEEELDRPVLGAPYGGTLRLLGLSHAVEQLQALEQPLDGQYLRAKRFVEEFQDYAMKLQNSDGSWGPGYLARRSAGRTTTEQVDGTGRVLEWLVLSLPEERLEDPAIVKSIDLLARLLGSRQYSGGLSGHETEDICSAMHAMHALMLYDDRYFKPRTPEPEPEEGQESPK